MNTAIIMSMLLTFVLSAVLGPLVLPWLRRLKFGQSILEIGPSWHKSKQGTPSAGGNHFYDSDCCGYANFGCSQSFFR